MGKSTEECRKGCDVYQEWCDLVNAYAELEAENKRLKEHLNHIFTCLLVLKNTKTEQGLKDLPTSLTTLYEYIEQALKEGE